MKKLLISLLSVTMLATVGLGVGNAYMPAEAATRSAVKSYHFDRNKYTGNESNFTHYKYVKIPSWSRQTGYQNQQIGGSWNYIRYLHTNFYQGGY